MCGVCPGGVPWSTSMTTSMTTSITTSRGRGRGYPCQLPWWPLPWWPLLGGGRGYPCQLPWWPLAWWPLLGGTLVNFHDDHFHDDHSGGGGGEGEQIPWSTSMMTTSMTTSITTSGGRGYPGPLPWWPLLGAVPCDLSHNAVHVISALPAYIVLPDSIMGRSHGTPKVEQTDRQTWVKTLPSRTTWRAVKIDLMEIHSLNVLLANNVALLTLSSSYFQGDFKWSGHSGLSTFPHGFGYLFVRFSKVRWMGDHGQWNNTSKNTKRAGWITGVF